jgi:hypothetical protein
MTRKDYEFIAKTIRDTQERIRATAETATPDWKAMEQLRGVRRVAAHFTDALREENPSFDAQRFLTACGYGA